MCEAEKCLIYQVPALTDHNIADQPLNLVPALAVQLPNNKVSTSLKNETIKCQFLINFLRTNFCQLWPEHLGTSKICQKSPQTIQKLLDTRAT